MRPPVHIALPDPTLERVRMAHHEAIRELQAKVTTLAAHPANLLQRQILTGAGTYTPHRNCEWKIVRQMGGGGGGGGVGGGAGLGAGGGGNSGWLLEYVDTTKSGGAYSCGAGGAAGGTAPSAGGTGGDTTIVLGGVTYTAKGGTGGTAATKAADGVAGPNALATGSSDVDIATYGEGGYGCWWNTAAGISGHGGNSPLGVGGYAVGFNANGQAGTNGGGGSGGASNTTASGGVGGDGIIVIDEYGP